MFIPCDYYGLQDSMMPANAEEEEAEMDEIRRLLQAYWEDSSNRQAGYYGGNDVY